MNRAALVAGAVTAEWTKFRSAPVPIVTTVLLVLGVPGIAAAALAAASGNGPAAAKVAAMVGDGGAEGFLAVVTQVSAAGGLVASGVVNGWVFGREFDDRTISGLLAQPTTPTMIAGAKFLVLALWSTACTVALAGVSLAAVGALGLEGGAGIGPSLVLLAMVSGLTAALAAVCALVASLARSRLAAVGAAVVLVALAQVAVLLGVGRWFPFATPGEWAASTVVEVDGRGGLAVAVVTAGLAAGATVWVWRRLRF